MTEIVTPEQFYGFKPGTDRKLVRWDRVVEYFWKLSEASDRIKVKEVGKTTEDHPMILAFISSPENLARLDELSEMSWSISHPRGLMEEEAERIVAEGKAVVAMTMSIHASEVGGTQGASDLAYRLLTCEDPLTKRIRDNVVFLLFPCANPDGQIMTVDWYNKNLGTEYEGCGLPWLYHKYTGHDNNRDALTLTQVETRIMNRVLLKEWYPQAYLDQHQMGFYGSRFFVPPNSNPVNEVADPLVWTEQKHYGAQMAIRMASKGISGVEQAAVFPADFMPGFSLVFPWFQICGMFTESASVKFATPVYVHYHQLQPHPRGRPEYRASVNFNDPWRGGWWHLGDIVKGQLTSAMATLEVAANNRKMILRNMYSKAKNSIEKGAEEAPYAFLVPPGQADPNTTHRFLKTLVDMSVEVHRADGPVEVGGVTYPEGTHVVFASQTARPFVVSLLSRTLYRDNLWVRSKDGVPMMNYDFATQTMAEFKGVEIVEADTLPRGEFRLLEEIEPPKAAVGKSKMGYLFDCRVNDSFKAVNRLQKAGVEVHRVPEEVSVGGQRLPPGTFYVPYKRGVESKLKTVAGETRVSFIGVEEKPGFSHSPVKPLRVAMYQRYWGGNMDEGWTRWLLEQFGFEYTTVRDEEVKAGLEGYDVLILPSDPPALITGEGVDEWYEKRYKGAFTAPVLPPEYKTGIGEEGVEKVKEFVEKGGTLLALYESCEFAIEKLKVPVLNTVKDLKPKEFHCPGSTIWTNIDNRHPLGYGMPARGLILLRGNHAYAVKANHWNENYRTVVSYPEENMMQSGWLIGEKHLARKAALIEAKMGEGRVVLYGFAPQMRALTDATFKLFFNALVG
ncbi:peptidase M14 family protein [Candidatus Bathyarchaeota archaeon]|nr:peptidase M14 family protein [Candidatus Bathyarchaeota archaeon]